MFQCFLLTFFFVVSGRQAEAFCFDLPDSTVHRHCHSRAYSASSSASSSAEGSFQKSPEQVGLRGLYPPSTAYINGTIAVDEIHTLYYELHGRGGEKERDPNNSKETPIRNALFLHGGPGAGCFPNHARFFDPKKYRVVLFDQRGAGRSTPRGEIRQNTLLDIIYDCERLRFHLGIPRWDVVLGGSWDATVAVAYAQEFPNSLCSVVLRGVCLMH